GVTFLAFGNGAPDVFSAVAAFADPRTAGLAIGALFGAGVFVTTVVAGSVALVKPFTVASRPFLRDVIFYMWAVFWTFLILYLREIKLGEALELPSDSEDATPGIFNGGIRDDDGLLNIEGEFPVWALVLLIGVFLSAISFLTTSNQQPPRLHCAFSLLGFVVSAMWINTAATEVVSILRTFGVVFDLSNTVLGLTLLAWGNSIGDCFSDITMARQGYPRMAMAACFGGIIFSILLCAAERDYTPPLSLSPSLPQLETDGLLVWVLAGALGLSLVLSFILVPAQCFHLGRSYGIFLLLFYLVFLLVALLTEFKVIELRGSP
ncbi:UNVERIFIED_CONTAM: hypothetical protein FKN15_039232, partial [Acipenser sinensis]